MAETVADVKPPEPKSPAPKANAGGIGGSGKTLSRPTRVGTPDYSRAHQIVIGAMIGTAAIILIADIRGGGFPSARQLVGLGFVFAAIAFLASVAPQIASPLALVVFAGVALTKGPQAIKGVTAASSSASGKLVGNTVAGPDSGTTGANGETTSGYIVGTGASPIAERAARFAVVQARHHVPYIRGGTTTNGFDCSGLTEAAYAFAGKIIPRTSEQQYAAGYPAVKWGEWAVGDLIFSQWPGDDASPGHVVMYVGNGQCVAAPHTGATVEFEKVETFGGSHYVGSCRPAPMRANTLTGPHGGSGQGHKQ